MIPNYLNFSLEDLPGEIWKDIIGKDYYQVSSCGRVKSLERSWSQVMPYGGVAINYVKEKILKPRSDPKFGYVRVSLGKGTKYFVHRLVAEAFLSNPENKSEVNHIDFIRNNNCVENLEWVDRTENVNYTIKAGRRPTIMINTRGAKHIHAKKVNQYDIKGNLLKTWDCVMDIIREYGYGTYAIYDCIKRKHKTHGGFKWDYTEEDKNKGKRSLKTA